MLLYSLCFVINKVFAYLINLYSESGYKFYLKSIPHFKSDFKFKKLYGIILLSAAVCGLKLKYMIVHHTAKIG